jgi:tetratricopeptide (TPR) repeat protein
MIQHYAAALEDKQEQLGHVQHLVEVMVQQGKEGEAAMLLAESEEPGELTEKSFESAGYRLLGYWKLAKKDSNGAMVAFREALRKEPGNTRARLGLGVCLATAREYALAVTELGRVIKSKGAPSGQAAQALIGRGAAMAQLGDLQGAIADFSAVVESAGVPTAQLAVAFLSRGHAKGQIGDAQGEIADYTAAAELAGAPVEHVATALFIRGMTKGQLGDEMGEIADYTAVIELAGAPADQVAWALLFSALALRELGKLSEAIASLQGCLEMRVSAATVHGSFAKLASILLANKRDAEAAGWMARLHEFETPDLSLEARLEARIQVIAQAGTEHGPDAAEALLDAALRGGPEDVRARLEFLGPAIQYAKSGDDLALSRLPERERDAAKQIAGSITKKDGGAAKK